MAGSEPAERLVTISGNNSPSVALGVERTPVALVQANASPTSLAEWQSHLAAHFKALATKRRELDWPVFALEHGLTEAQRYALAKEIRRVDEIDQSLEVDYLAWAVYAAELGYLYDGDDYWPTFLGATPNWPDRQRDRDNVRFAFRTFSRNYGGVSPSGRWAGHFGIIAWPITHSILPRDLQTQLAELLYHARVTFREEIFSSVESLGHHLQTLSGGYSARFREFARDEVLLGHIALALLLHQTPGDAKSGGTSLIHPPTLERLIADLSRERDAREFLIAARSELGRFRIRGLARIPYRTPGAERSASPTAMQFPRVEDTALRAIARRPRFLLRPASVEQWNVWVQFPNLAPLVAAMPHAREALERSSGVVAGAPSFRLARGRILSDAWPEARLGEWPKPSSTLLTFDGAPPELTALLNVAFRIPPGEDWLFIIGADGQARELTTRILRAGESYVLLRREPISNPAAGLRPINIVCSGVHGFRIDLPVEVPEILVAVLRVLNLQVAQTLEVWPVGLPVADWSGDGTAETLSGESLLLAVRSDRALQRLVVTVDDEPPTIIRVSGEPLGKPVYVLVPPLNEGRHRLTMLGAPVETDERDSESIAERESRTLRSQESSRLAGSLEVTVRNPRLLGDARNSGALSFAIHPRAPSLEDLWEDRCELHVSAPGAKWISCRISLTAKGLNKPIHARDFQLQAPINTASWRGGFREIREGLREYYDEAHACVLDFKAGSLGRARVTCERDFTPLRWMVRKGGEEVVLVDSSGLPNLSVTRYGCDTPDVAQTVDRDVACRGLPMTSSGALLYATSGDVEAAVVAVPRQRVSSLAALAMAPRIQTYRKEPNDLERLAILAGHWERARIGASSLTEERRDAAFRALHSHLIAVIAGERWAKAEAAHRRTADPTDSIQILRTLVSTRVDERVIAASLLDKVRQLGESSTNEREDTFRMVLTSCIPALRATDELASFALRLATSPMAAVDFCQSLGERQTIEERTDGQMAASAEGTSVRDRLDSLIASPLILRAARFLVLAFGVENDRRKNSQDVSALGVSSQPEQLWNW